MLQQVTGRSPFTSSKLREDGNLLFFILQFIILYFKEKIKVSEGKYLIKGKRARKLALYYLKLLQLINQTTEHFKRHDAKSKAYNDRKLVPGKRHATEYLTAKIYHQNLNHRYKYHNYNKALVLT